VLYLTYSSLIAQHTPKMLWTKIGLPLQVTQTLAVLEVLHSILRLVPSPVVSTFLQVTSRIVLVWGFTSVSLVARSHWSLYLMVGSWALVEVPRYAFYAINLITSKVPGPLFWLRYNLFAILYPTGITGEVLQVLKTMPMLKDISLVYWYSALLWLLSYVPGAPFMYSHMIVQRKKAFEKRKQAAQAKQAPPLAGVEYPVDAKGERSTTPVNKGAFEAAIAAVDKNAAEAVRKERNWRFGYGKHVVRNVEISCQSTEKCLKIANAGLDYLHNTFEFIRDGKTMKLSEAMATIKSTFHTGFIKGTKSKPDKFEYTVPYKGKALKGKELLDQLNKWADYGTIEPDVRDAIAQVVTNSEWVDLSDKYFVLLGAGSAMGPLLQLLELGANVIAVDLDRSPIWKRLITTAKNSCGTITFPLKKPQSECKDDDDLYENAGCDLFKHTPEIANWVQDLYPGKQLIIGGYAYLDGARFLKVSIAMDAIIKKVLEKRKNAALAFLCSPTDVFVCPNEARDAMLENYKNRPLWQKLIESLTKILVKNARPQVTADDGTKYSIVDGIVVPQGPNYALSKRLQHWRCMIARMNGHLVSTNIAPSTATASVVHNAQFAAAYGGMHLFKPMEVMYQETSNAVMAALLIHDIRNPQSIKNPSVPLRNPQELFSKGSFHGGIWRMAYKMNTIGAISALAYYMKKYKLPLTGVLAGFAGIVAFIIKNGPPHKWL
jgi:hypothetical protein